jgi:cobalt-zinc-cadmium resistance protein CzcA
MTTLVATLGLLPAALSNGIGAQTQKPLAVVVIGGSLILAILTRVVQPPLLVVAHTWLDNRRRRGGSGGPPSLQPSHAHGSIPPGPDAELA